MNHPHEILMTEALALAERGRGWTSPNPVVGALVVKDGAVLGRGWHQKFGGPHAEVFALREAGESARGATLYCTLEPCGHFGKTPPCAQAVIDAGIKTVVLGARDPNPRAAGGCALLRAAGIDVVENVCERECRRINAPFFKFIATGLPFVSLKWAMTLDGKISANSGDSKWISSAPSRAYVHQLRARSDAVAVGAGTVRADDPTLNVRAEKLLEAGFVIPEHGVKQPARVIFDSRAGTPLTGNLWNAATAGTLVIVAAESTESSQRERVARLREQGAEVLEISPDSSGRPHLEPALRALGKLGYLALFVEGGAELLGSFLDAKIADQVHVFIAPKIVGGQRSRSAVAGIGVERMSAAIALEEASLEVKRFNSDVLVEGALSNWARF